MNDNFINEPILKSLFFQTSLGVVILSQNLDILHVNNKFCDQLYYSEAELININLKDIIKINDVDLFTKKTSTIKNNFPKDISMKENLIRKDSSIFYAELSFLPISNEHCNEIVCIVHYLLNDTIDKKLIENNLLNLKRKFLDSIIKMPLGYIEIDKNFDFTNCNPYYEVICGYKKDYIIGKNFFDLLIPNDNKELILNSFKSAINENNVHKGTMECINKDGKRITCNWYLSVLANEYENFYGWSILFQDISKEISANKILEQSRDNIKSILEYAPLTIFISSLNGKILFANNSALDFFEIKNSILEDLNIYDIYSNYSDLNDIIKVVNGDGFINNFELSALTLSGIKKWVTLSAIGIDYNGEKCILCSQYDITEKKDILETLLLAKQEAEHTTAAKNQFIANISHEIRTPLNAIIGFSELLSYYNDNKNDSTYNKYISSISVAGKSLLSLVNDIIDLSKLEAGMMEIRSSKVNTLQFFSELEQIFVQDLSSKTLNFIIDLDANLPKFLLLDAKRLRQILVNLMGNAIKFTNNGYIKLSAKLIFIDPLNNTSGNLIISISDTGIGIDKKDFNIIFEYFRQVSGDDNRKYSGSGLGLSITKKLIETLDGKIKVESILGEGSNFTIEIPNILVGTTSHSKYNVFSNSYDKMVFNKSKVINANLDLPLTEDEPCVSLLNIDFFTSIKSEVLPLINPNLEAIQISDLTIAAEILINLGTKYKSSPLRIKGELLSESIASFDLDLISENTKIIYDYLINIINSEDKKNGV